MSLQHAYDLASVQRSGLTFPPVHGRDIPFAIKPDGTPRTQPQPQTAMNDEDEEDDEDDEKEQPAVTSADRMRESQQFYQRFVRQYEEDYDRMRRKDEVAVEEDEIKEEMMFIGVPESRSAVNARWQARARMRVQHRHLLQLLNASGYDRQGFPISTPHVAEYSSTSPSPPPAPPPPPAHVTHAAAHILADIVRHGSDSGLIQPDLADLTQRILGTIQPFIFDESSGKNNNTVPPTAATASSPTSPPSPLRHMSNAANTAMLTAHNGTSMPHAIRAWQFKQEEQSIHCKQQEAEKSLSSMQRQYALISRMVERDVSRWSFRCWRHWNGLQKRRERGKMEQQQQRMREEQSKTMMKGQTMSLMNLTQPSQMMQRSNQMTKTGCDPTDLASAMSASDSASLERDLLQIESFFLWRSHTKHARTTRGRKEEMEKLHQLVTDVEQSATILPSLTQAGNVRMTAKSNARQSSSSSSSFIPPPSSLQLDLLHRLQSLIDHLHHLSTKHLMPRIQVDERWSAGMTLLFERCERMMTWIGQHAHEAPRFIQLVQRVQDESQRSPPAKAGTSALAAHYSPQFQQPGPDAEPGQTVDSLIHELTLLRPGSSTRTRRAKGAEKDRQEDGSRTAGGSGMDVTLDPCASQRRSILSRLSTAIESEQSWEHSMNHTLATQLDAKAFLVRWVNHLLQMDEQLETENERRRRPKQPTARTNDENAHAINADDEHLSRRLVDLRTDLRDSILYLRLLRTLTRNADGGNDSGADKSEDAAPSDDSIPQQIRETMKCIDLHERARIMLELYATAFSTAGTQHAEHRHATSSLPHSSSSPSFSPPAIPHPFHPCLSEVEVVEGGQQQHGNVAADENGASMGGGVKGEVLGVGVGAPELHLQFLAQIFLHSCHPPTRLCAGLRSGLISIEWVTARQSRLSMLRQRWSHLLGLHSISPTSFANFIGHLQALLLDLECCVDRVDRRRSVLQAWQKKVEKLVWEIQRSFVNQQDRTAAMDLDAPPPYVCRHVFSSPAAAGSSYTYIPSGTIERILAEDPCRSSTHSRSSTQQHSDDNGCDEFMHEEVESIRRYFDLQSADLRCIFDYYASASTLTSTSSTNQHDASHNDSSDLPALPSQAGISLQSFIRFVADCSLMQSTGANGVSEEQVNHIFHMCTQSVSMSGGGDEQLGSNSKGRVPASSAALSYSSFLDSLLHLSHAAFHATFFSPSSRTNPRSHSHSHSHACSLSFLLRHTFTRHIQSLSSRQTIESFRGRNGMRSEQLRKIMEQRYQSSLVALFTKYVQMKDAQGRSVEGEGADEDGLSIGQLEMMLRDAGLMANFDSRPASPSSATTPAPSSSLPPVPAPLVRSLFVRVQQDADFGDHRSSMSQRMSFVEFIEFLAALSCYFYPDPLLPLASKVDRFLSSTLLQTT